MKNEVFITKVQVSLIILTVLLAVVAIGWGAWIALSAIKDNLDENHLVRIEEANTSPRVTPLGNNQWEIYFNGYSTQEGRSLYFQSNNYEVLSIGKVQHSGTTYLVTRSPETP